MNASRELGVENERSLEQIYLSEAVFRFFSEEIDKIRSQGRVETEVFGVLLGRVTHEFVRVEGVHRLEDGPIWSAGMSAAASGSQVLGWCAVAAGESSTPTDTEFLLHKAPILNAGEIAIFLREAAPHGRADVYFQGAGKWSSRPPRWLGTAVVEHGAAGVKEAVRLTAETGAVAAQSRLSPRVRQSLLSARKASVGLFACIGISGTITFMILFLKPGPRGTPVAHAAAAGVVSVGTMSRKGSDIELKVQSVGDRVQISWNRDATAIQNASQGMFTIDDGVVHRSIELNAEQVADGSIVYRPHSDDASFRLEVVTDKGSLATGMVRILGGGSEPVVRAIAGGGRAAVPKPVMVAVAQPEKPPAPNAEALRPPVTAEPAHGPAAPPVADVAPVAAEAAHAKVVALTADAAPVVDGPALSGELGVPDMTTQAVPVPFSTEESKKSPVAPALASSYVAPQVITKVSPKLPQNDGAPTTTVEVNIQVHIDERGRVTSAHYTNAPVQITPAAMLAIGQAAKLWRFTPAMRGGKPVASDFSILFRIHAGR